MIDRDVHGNPISICLSIFLLWLLLASEAALSHLYCSLKLPYTLGCVTFIRIRNGVGVGVGVRFGRSFIRSFVHLFIRLMHSLGSCGWSIPILILTVGLEFEVFNGNVLSEQTDKQSIYIL